MHGAADTAIQVDPRVRRLLVFAVVPIVAITAIGMLVLRPTGAGPDLTQILGEQVDLVDGTVSLTDTTFCAGTTPDVQSFCQTVTVRLTSGDGAGESIQFENAISATSPLFETGDRIVLGRTGAGGETTYYFADYQRKTPLLLLGTLFVGAVIGLARWRGARALVALGLSLVVLVYFTLPSVLRGHSPVAVALVSAMCIMLVVLYVTDGLTVRATIAVLGTAASLLLIAGLAWAFVELTQLSGLASEEAGFISAAASEINIQGLLLGGVIIGALGVLDDMTVTQVSAVWELHGANPHMGVGGLYRVAERIGRDHIASTVNTLVLAYAGASLPIMILLVESHQGLANVLNGEVVAVEIVRTLVGSIGLVASVPITTWLAAFVLTRETDSTERAQMPRPRRPKIGDWVNRRRHQRQTRWSRPSGERAWRGENGA